MSDMEALREVAEAVAAEREKLKAEMPCRGECKSQIAAYPNKRVLQCSEASEPVRGEIDTGHFQTQSWYCTLRRGHLTPHVACNPTIHGIYVWGADLSTWDYHILQDTLENLNRKLKETP